MQYNKNNYFIKSHGHIVLYALLIILMFLTCIHSFTSPLGLYDEGFLLTNAWRIMGGEIPHKDYWAAYPPGTSYTLAASFFLIEPSLTVARFINLIWTLLLLSSFFFTLRHFASKWTSLVATTAASLWVSASLYPSYSATPALALIFFSMATFFQGIKTNQRGYLAIGGVAAGSILLFRHDFSGYLFFSLLLSVSILAVFTPSTRQEMPFKSTLNFLILFLTVAIMWLVYILINSGFSNFFEQAIAFPATGMRANRLLPFPGFLDMFGAWRARWFLAWIVPAAVLVGYFYFMLAKLQQEYAEKLALGIFASLAIFLTIQAHNRLDMPHVAPSMLFALCFIVILTKKPLTNTPVNNAIRYLFIFLFGAYSLLTTTRDIKFNAALRCISHPAIFPCIPTNKIQTEAVNYILNNSAQSDYVFVGNTRHDMIYVNDASFYFLTKRPIPIKWNEMHPGIVTTQHVQEEIINQLDFKRVKWVVLADMPISTERNLSAISSNVYLLDSYIKNNYRTIFSNKMYLIMQRSSNFNDVTFRSK